MDIDIEDALRQSELTHGLTDTEIKDLAQVFHPRHIKKNETVFKEGDPGNDLYLIHRGRIAVLIQSTRLPGEKEKIAVLCDNDIFGEFSLIDSSTRSATVVAEEDSNILYVDYLDFHRYLQENEHVGYLVMRNLSRILTGKLRKMNFELRNSN